jgi:hypothetical protein
LGKDDPTINSTVLGIIEEACTKQIPLIIDGDGLSIVAQQPNVLKYHTKSFKNVILTPNAAEFQRLWTAFLPDEHLPSISLPVDDKLLEFMVASTHYNLYIACCRSEGVANLSQFNSCPICSPTGTIVPN